MLAEKDISRINSSSRLAALLYHFSKKKDTLSKATTNLIYRRFRRLKITAHKRDALLKKYKLSLKTTQ